MPHSVDRCGAASNLRFHITSPAFDLCSHAFQIDRQLVTPRAGSARSGKEGLRPAQLLIAHIPVRFRRPTDRLPVPPFLGGHHQEFVPVGRPVEVLGPSGRTMERPGQSAGTLPSATRAACRSCPAAPGIRCSPPRPSSRARPHRGRGIEMQPVSVGLTGHPHQGDVGQPCLLVAAADIAVDPANRSCFSSCPCSAAPRGWCHRAGRKAASCSSMASAWKAATIQLLSSVSWNAQRRLNRSTAGRRFAASGVGIPGVPTVSHTPTKRMGDPGRTDRAILATLVLLVWSARFHVPSQHTTRRLPLPILLAGARSGVQQHLQFPTAWLASPESGGPRLGAGARRPAGEEEALNWRHLHARSTCLRRATLRGR